MGALLGEPGGGGSFAGDSIGYERKALEMGIFLHGGSVGQPGVGSSTRDFERWLKGALGMGHLSLKRLTAKGLERGLLYWGPWVMKGRLWGRASLFMGSQLVNLEWPCLLGTLRDG
jgi:hypothetical protein